MILLALPIGLAAQAQLKTDTCATAGIIKTNLQKSDGITTIITPSGGVTTAVKNGNISTIVNSNGTHSTIIDHGAVSVIVNPDGTHSVVIKQ